MNNHSAGPIRPTAMVALSLLAWQYCEPLAEANPTGGTVAQGAATISSSGSQTTVTTTTANAYINWQSFNIGAGETTTFAEPSATSVVWNNVGGASPSSILGSINANGYVILQNQNGFAVGGSAVINAHGLVMTTAPTPEPELSGGGAWSFNAPPPAAQIINYGQINIGGGGSAFLIASSIQNNGTISAPGGKIGLYAGEQVLVSTSPDGRGLSAQVTLPQGSVDNEGNLIADGGTIAAQAQTVNQNGLVQANSVQNINGVIELVASDSLTLGASSDIEAHGDSSATSASPGGFVVLQAGNTFADTPTSIINVAGNTSTGGSDGAVEIFGNNLTDATSIQSQIDGMSAVQFQSTVNQFGSTDILLVNPYDITLSSNPTDPAATGTTANGVTVSTPNLNINDLAAYSQIDIRALDNIELSANWSLVDPGAPASLSLQAGNDIILDDASSIVGGNNWSVNLTAGTSFVPTAAQPTPPSGSDGIYLNCSTDDQNSSGSFIQTQNGDINLWAANEVQVAPGGSDSVNGDEVGFSGITTQNGGNINVTTVYGDVNTGANPLGYDYHAKAPYYTVTSGDGANLGGISTAAGGNVTITAGGNVFSYLPSANSSDISADGGSGAFGPEAGNVTITAGSSVYGHYVVANGAGSITAGQDVGAATGNPFALSLIAGSWTVNAPNGDIYLQEVRNPNGDFNDVVGKKNAPNLGQFLFDYSADGAVDLNAAGVYLTDDGVPRLAGNYNVPVLYPPILDINAGAGGVTLGGNVTLFPSPDQNLNLTTTDGGNLSALPSLSGTYELLMSDSSSKQWLGASSGSFSDSDNSTGTPEELNNPNPVVINVAGNMENLNLITSEATHLTVGGDMINCGFSGQNLHASDVTYLKVGGQIFNQGAYAFVAVGQGIPDLPTADLPPGYGNSWQNIFTLALNPSLISGLAIPANLPSSQWGAYAIEQASLFGYTIQAGEPVGVNPGFIYNAATGQLGFGGAMPSSVLAYFTQSTFTVLRYNSDGVPETTTVKNADGTTSTVFVTDQVSWAPPSSVAALSTLSQVSSSPTDVQLGYRIGGPGEFDVDAGSISLGNSYGILSCGVADPDGGFGRYANLVPETPVGANLNVTVSGDLTMLTSTIASLGGGNLNVNSTGGSMDLGSEALYNTSRQVGFGVFTAGPGNVDVTAYGDVDIDGSRIASYDGGNIFIESQTGNVNVGSGGDTFTGVGLSFVDAKTGQAEFYAEDVYGNGIVANTLVPPPVGEAFPANAASLPGNITVETPRGDIASSLGGITQEALDGNIAGGPTITLTAGTPSSGTVGTAGYFAGYPGNIDLGESGVIGGTVNLTANGNISGLIISRQGTTIVAAQNFVGTVLSGGAADVSGGGSVSGVIVGVGGASVSGGSVTASVLGQNVSVNGGASQSTLGASSGATASSQSAANTSTSQAQQQVASNSGPDDDQKKKKPALMQRIKRVTVILPDKT